MFRQVIYFGLFCLAVSLFLPALAKEDRVMSGYDALTFSYRYSNSGSLGLFVEALASESEDPRQAMAASYMRWIGWAWMANASAALGLFVLFIRSKDLLRIFTVVSGACVLLAAGGVLIPLVHGSMPEYGLGFWAWLFALGLCFVGQVMALGKAIDGEA